MNCSECRPILPAYVDDELDVRAALEMETHIASCAACASRHRALRELSGAVRTHASRFTPSLAFEQRLRASLNGSATPETGARRPWMQRAALVVPLVAALVLAWLGGVWWSRPSDAQRLGREVVLAHVRSLLGEHLTDVASSDRHTVNPWFQGKVPFAPGAKDLASDGFALVGGRLDYVDGHPVAALVYRHGPHAMNVFLWPSENESEEPVTKFTARGYSAFHWVQGGLNRWAVSDSDAATLLRLVDRLRSND